jgi:GNAT superfamily N-acetyltransferase
MTELMGHDCQTSGKPGEWAIHCIFVKDGFRGQGISTKLIQAASGIAKENGAKLVSAFPIPDANRSKFPPNEAEFSGRYSTYAKLGFKAAGAGSDFYQRMELVQP